MVSLERKDTKSSSGNTTARPPDNTKTVFAGNETGSVPMVAKAAWFPNVLYYATGGLGLVLVVLSVGFLVKCCCRRRDTVYNVNLEEQKHLTLTANGNIVSNHKPKQDNKKEVYVWSEEFMPRLLLLRLLEKCQSKWWNEFMVKEHWDIEPC